MRNAKILSGAAAAILPAAGLWLLTGAASTVTLRLAVIALVYLVGGAFAAGFYFGRVEVRGVLRGLDVGLEKLALGVDLRDNSRLRVHRETARPARPAYVYTPPAIQIAQVDAGGEVIDL